MSDDFNDHVIENDDSFLSININNDISPVINFEDGLLGDLGLGDLLPVSDFLVDTGLGFTTEIDHIQHENIFGLDPIHHLDEIKDSSEISFGGFDCSAGCAGNCAGNCSETCADSCYDRCSSSYSS